MHTSRGRAACAAAICWLFAMGTSPSVAAQDLSSIDSTLRGFITAFDNLDMPSFIEYFADDATFFNRPGPTPGISSDRNDGKAAIRDEFQKVFTEIRRQSGRTAAPFQDIQPQDLRVQPLGDVAIVTFHLGTPQARGRRTLVLRRIDGGWKIEHLHASTFVASR